MSLARSRMALLAIGLVAVALLPGAPASAQTDPHGMDHAAALYAGNAAPYPRLRSAGPSNRLKARTLSLAVLLAAGRFDTLAEAAELGYVADPVLSPLYRPGLQHFRKNRLRAWGRVLNPRAPQALVFWCPSSGDCRLAAFMFRAPPRLTPPTFGGLLGWHRHSGHGTWMTHIWLTRRAMTALAQCAPFDAMQAYNPMLVWEPYQADVPIDDPCPDTAGLAGGLDHTSGMPVGHE